MEQIFDWSSLIQMDREDEKQGEAVSPIQGFAISWAGFPWALPRAGSCGAPSGRFGNLE